MTNKHVENTAKHYTKDPVPVGWMRRFKYMHDMYRLIEDVKGDIVECGVGEGTTFAMLAYLAGSENGSHKRAVHGFDSFEGFPEPHEADDSWRKPKKGEWTHSEDETWHQLEASGVREAFPDLEIRVIKGFFGDSLPKEPEYQIAFLHADGDLYESYRDILEHFYPRVTKGGLVLFDEYKDFKPDKEGEKWPGASKAIEEYFEPLGLSPQLHKESGKYYIVKP